ncbi:nuclear transport factor 2 family protein [Sphingomonas sp. CL5.1]|uniref:nuclear transport factor 2 family protein n=1 Tax=Sphingomonas sp. CL5.1 TaxID=2653203 RepID=UPI001583E2D8|nr:nuclear transport factor 2 family protein [Sphingomonas sp. CL5.1]QKS00596.1 nuclear transport factor 2 family protein [Sphingomonas sp. CL5.1]
MTGVLALIATGPVMAAEGPGSVGKSMPMAAPGPEIAGLDRLLAMEEMKNLRQTFCRSLDSHDWNLLRTTISDDFEMYFAQTDGPDGPNVRPPIEVSGVTDYMAWLKRYLTGHSIHICTMPQFVFVTANRARALWFIQGYGEIGGQSGMGFERIIEDYVRINGKWLIKKADGRVEAYIPLPK